MSGKAGSGRAGLRELLADTVVEAGTEVPDIEVTDITSTSSRVTAGALFIACRGQRHHGIEFADEAAARGARAIVWEPDATCRLPALPAGVPTIPVPNLSAEVGLIADRFFAAPSAQISVTGITGTNGKTTVAWLTSQARRLLGGKSAYMGTIGYGIGSDLSPSALTTPGVISVHRRLRELADKGADSVDMEVSSHALDQGRLDGVRVRTAAFTNLSRDHLDYHSSFEAYGDAKSKLFKMASLENAVINAGDAFGASLAKKCAATVNVISVALQDRLAPGVPASLTASVTNTTVAGITLEFGGEFGTARMQSPLWGRFNAENLLVAAGLLLADGIALPEAVAALERCTAPEGRMQLINNGPKQPMVIVDFAHTPDALAQVIEVIRQHCSGAVTVVFGCGGERDKGKRGEMGSAASRLANRIIVTDDNPRNEDPQAIIDDILAGIASRSTVEVERDRAKAIELAIQGAAAGDAVLIAGKGSERNQLIADAWLPFCDAEVAASILREVS